MQTIPLAKRVSGFSLIEVLIVMAIMALLSAILFPVLGQAKESTQKTVCASNLHQDWLAIGMYRSDYDGDSLYGGSYDMGLPPRLSYLAYRDPLEAAKLTPQALLRIEGLKCSHWPSKLSNSGFSYNLMYQDPPQMNNQNRWDKYVEEFKEDAILIVDVNHNPRDIPVFSKMISKVGFGLTVGGRTVKQRKPGDPDILRWWTSPCSADCPLN